MATKSVIGATVKPKERKAYLQGILHAADADQRRDLAAYLATGLESAANFQSVADGLAKSVADDAANDGTAFDLAYGHAFGIMHRLGNSSDSDNLKESLIKKYGFDEDIDMGFGVNHRLNALHEEVEQILASRFVEAESESRGILGASKLPDHYKHNDRLWASQIIWTPNPDATVEDCLDAATGMLIDAMATFDQDDKLTPINHAAVRLVALAKELVSQIHSKLLMAVHS